jgi:tight adherence protein C
MHGLGIVVGVVGLVGGVAVLGWGLVGARPEVPDAIAYLGTLDDEVEETDAYQQRLAQPFLRRVLAPLGGGALKGIASLTPGKYLDGLHAKLLHAGLSAQVSAEEFATGQVLLTSLGVVAVLAWSFLGSPPQGMGILVVVLIPAACALVPMSWLNRKVAERKESIFRDLPDVLDLLAISVEAGLGFEQAIAVVCEKFVSPLAEEFARTLREMELGLPRREALQNLKRRTEVPELSNFVLALTQADALGMPIGRILRTQADEMRSKRRQWAREKAGKLPVKILFPLVACIFPAVLIVLMGPAASSIMKAFKK